MMCGVAVGLITCCSSVHSASAGADERVGVPRASISLPETVTPQVVALEAKWVVHVFVRGSRALSVASETTVPLLALILK